VSSAPGAGFDAGAACGAGPLFGPGSPYHAAALLPRIRAREAARLEIALTAVEQRELERGWENPPLAAGFAALEPLDRERLLLLPDLRRWIARVIRATHPHSAPDAALPVQVQAAWNLLAAPWLKTPASERGHLWLLVFADGSVPFPGTGLRLVRVPGGRRIRIFRQRDYLYFHAEHGVRCGEVLRTEFLAAAGAPGAAAAGAPGAGAAGVPPVPDGFAVHPRLAGTDIEVVPAEAARGTGGAAGTADALLQSLLPALDDALRRLAAGWPAGHDLVTALVHRVQLDPHPELNSKSVSELPGLVILGGHVHDPVGLAELLVHEAMHLLVYEMERLEAILPALAEPRHSPFSRAETRPAYMLLHGAASFLAQAIATARLAGDRAAATPVLARESERLAVAERELRAHVAAHGAEPHPFVEAVFAEMAAFRRAVG
jgi:HEXXH motif-containing protein